MKMTPIILLSLVTISSQLTAQLELLQISQGFSSPVALANAADGTNRLFVVERSGVIKIIDDLGTGSTLSTPFLDIQSRVESGGEKGLLGLAFHPSYPDSPYFFVNFTFRELGQLKTKVARYTVSSDPNIADPLSALQIIKVDQPFSNHNAGDIKFGPDDYLYITLGDGGSGGDPGNRAQDTTELLGSLLRIDIDGDDFPVDDEHNYRIPVDNPFVGRSGYRDEFWAIGLRNPWRISFDRMTGDLWIADVGQSSREEVNVQGAGSGGGQNYGWSCMEGTLTPHFNPCISGPLTNPVFEYPRSDGFSITGGFVYRGGSFPNLQGDYIVADYGSGNFWTINSATFSAAKIALLSSISTFGESESGELYVARLSDGKIFRVFDSSICDDVVNIIDHNQAEYAADILITSDVPVTTGQDIHYKSPTVELESPFEVAGMANFESLTLSCMRDLHQNNH